MKIPLTLCSFILPAPQSFSPISASAKDLGCQQPKKTWVFVVGALNWKDRDMFGSFPVKNRRDAALVDFFKQSGVPETRPS